MTPLGIQEASCGIIGNCIGANNVDLASRFFYLITKVNFFIVLILSLTVLFGRYQIVAFFTEDEDV